MKDVKIFGGKSALPIKEFKLDMLKLNPTICMIAKRRSGKSWVCRSLIKHFENIPCGLIIAKTEQMSSFYSNFFPDIYIYFEYKSEILGNLFERQQKMIEKCKLHYARGKKVDPRAYLVMDDCLSSKSVWAKDQKIAELFHNGRHYQLTFILTMQYAMGIAPELRSNFDYIFLLAEDFFSNQKRLHDHYAGMCYDFSFFRQIFTQLTADFGCMVIVNTSASASLLDKIFYYKAEDVPINMVGCQQFKKFHENNYDKNYQSKVNEVDVITQFLPKNNKPNVPIRKIRNRDDDD